jgi:hypothetical protein
VNLGPAELLIVLAVLVVLVVPVGIVIAVVIGASRRNRSSPAGWTGPAPTTPPGWHPDPARRHEARWWDGNRWTESVADQGITGTDPV